MFNGVRSLIDSVHIVMYIAGMTVTHLRRNIYRILDSIIATGKSITIERKGKTIIIACVEGSGKIEKLKVKPVRKAYIGDSDELVDMDWSEEWNPEPT
jgi:transcriptional regulatory protein LevR